MTEVSHEPWDRERLAIRRFKHQTSDCGHVSSASQATGKTPLVEGPTERDLLTSSLYRIQKMHYLNSCLLLVALQFSLSNSFSRLSAAESVAPNVLFIIADDASRHYGQAYGCDWVKTPNIDQLARQGIVFDNAYVPTSKCAPCRAAIITGRNPWQLEEAGNHQARFPAKFVAFGEGLTQAGVYCGKAGKLWGPGIAEDANGTIRDFGFPSFGGKDKPGESFARFLEQRPPGSPFFYWFGSSKPHRGYRAGAGLAAGKKTSDIDRVPAYWPDNDVVRGDMLDYAMEVEAFDRQAGELLRVLEESGEASNTLVIITSDHGMPFPRVKGHTYDDANRVPMIASWPGGIVNPGRRATDLVSLIDLAPTFLEIYSVDAQQTGMASITGTSFVDLLLDQPHHQRRLVLLGRERNDVYARSGTKFGLGYPVRAIRSGDYLYIRNFAPDRWPCGDPIFGLLDTDKSPTKQYLEQLDTEDPFWQHAFGKRPAEQLFDLTTDPDCVTNLAGDPRRSEARVQLHDALMAELKKQADPRMLGRGNLFDNYPSTKMRTPPNWKK